MIRHLHRRADNQDLVSILVLNLTDDIKFSVVVEIESLASQAIEVDFEGVCLLQVLAVLDADLEVDLVRLTLLELEFATAIL